MEVKNSTFFTESEDLYSIVSTGLKNPNKNIKKISTGWTNIVLDVLSDNQNYIVRLPRNDFFSRQIEKDVEACNFIKNNINITTSSMEIKYHNERPYSTHKKIEGNSLTERLEHLSNDKINQIAKNIAETYYRFHTFNTSKLPNHLKVRFYDFLIDLPKLQNEKYDFSVFNQMLEDESNENKVFVYGDLSIGNIILNENDEIKAYIDFSFCSLSDIYTDISRISCRISEEFFQKIINEYENISCKKLNMLKIENRRIMWDYVEKKYIKYMKNVYPEVEV